MRVYEHLTVRAGPSVIADHIMAVGAKSTAPNSYHFRPALIICTSRAKTYYAKWLNMTFEANLPLNKGHMKEFNSFIQLVSPKTFCFEILQWKKFCFLENNLCSKPVANVFQSD